MILPDGILDVCIGALLGLQGWQLKQHADLRVKIAILHTKLEGIEKSLRCPK